ncbi:hypothetical protein JQ604_14100 [Bradyrhizobium jicamae]|uniref:hypothetical protein n=1 Tax=Bradyrhizobium jicamae TaxID=280332 RepID=UPI001BA648ED|nr:hypothetical protein [Bradyrhizobium jicamae]MBR0753318.1 hypothetical protein [Bradyrhizobium jicamae]
MSHTPSESELEEIELLEFTEGAIKTTMQAALLGTLIAWTPSLFMLAYMARDIQPVPGEQHD